MTTFVVSVLGGASLGGTYALVALGVVLIFRSTGTFNFAHGQLMLLPAFLVGAWQASDSAPIGVSIATAIAISAGIGACFYLLVVQRTTANGVFMGVIATLGLAAILDGLRGIVFGAGAVNIRLPGVPHGVVHVLGAPVAADSLVLTAFSLALAASVAMVVQFTDLGRRVRAAGQDPVLASYSGLNVRALHVGSWAVAGALAAVAGIVYGSTNIVEPTMARIALAAFPAILIGGLDSISGAVVGGLFVGILQGFIASYGDANLSDVGTYSLLLVVMLVFPSGLFGTKDVVRV